MFVCIQLHLKRSIKGDREMKSKKLKLLWLLIIPVVIAYALYLPTIILGDDYLPENALTAFFVRTSPVIQDLFGEIQQVSLNNDGGACAHVSFRGGPHGWHRYDVVGSKDSGTIVVNWQSQDRRGKNFEVLSVERCVQGEKNKVIWKQE
jgi:hypothetical protein